MEPLRGWLMHSRVQIPKKEPMFLNLIWKKGGGETKLTMQRRIGMEAAHNEGLSEEKSV